MCSSDLQGCSVTEPWEVPALLDVTVVSGLPLPPPGAGLSMAPLNGLPLPFPVLRDEC